MTQHLSPYGKTILRNIIPALEKLSKGQLISLDQADQDFTLSQIRAQLYIHLKESFQKPYFRVHINEEQTTLTIKLLSTTPCAIRSNSLSFIDTYIIDNLLEITSYEDAAAIARTDLEANKITYEQVTAIMTAWEKHAGQNLAVKAVTPQIDPFELVNPQAKPKPKPFHSALSDSLPEGFGSPLTSNPKGDLNV